MARIILGSYMVRYPLGGMLSWVLQFLSGFKRLGHEITFVEKSTYPDDCFDPRAGEMTSRCRYGVETLNHLLRRVGLEDAWCFVDIHGTYHGLSRQAMAERFRTADVFIDMGTHGSWMEEAGGSAMRVLLDGEPGFTQMKMANAQAEGSPWPAYDRYFTVGMNVGTTRSSAPTAGHRWEHIVHPVDPLLFSPKPPPPEAPFTTIMNWQSHAPITFEGRSYHQKDVEFEKFMTLPSRVDACTMEMAVSGRNTPRDRLRSCGWNVRGAHEVTLTWRAFMDYLCASRGEFSVCKNVFVATHSGWFSDRSAAYLASGRPVVLQDTGFSRHLPCGNGLFAVNTAEEAADAINRIRRDYAAHAAAARTVAETILNTKTVLAGFLNALGL